MKSYLLEGIRSVEVARDALRELLPGQEEPWLLSSALADPIAYFSVGTELDGERSLYIEANVSGRHYADDAEVLEIIEKLQTLLGGVVSRSS